MKDNFHDEAWDHSIYLHLHIKYFVASLAKFKRARGASHHQTLMENCHTFYSLVYALPIL